MIKQSICVALMVAITAIISPAIAQQGPDESRAAYEAREAAAEARAARAREAKEAAERRAAAAYEKSRQAPETPKVKPSN